MQFYKQSLLLPRMSQPDELGPPYQRDHQTFNQKRRLVIAVGYNLKTQCREFKWLGQDQKTSRRNIIMLAQTFVKKILVVKCDGSFPHHVFWKISIACAS